MRFNYFFMRLALTLAVVPFIVSLSLAQLPVVAYLDSTQAGTSSPARGTFWGVLSPDYDSLVYQVTVNDLQGTITAAHFHYEGDGSIIEPISFSGKTASGVWTNFPDSILRAISAEQVYVNVHTTSVAGGEISGYLEIRQHGFGIKMDGAQAGTASAGLGTGWAVLEDSGRIEYHMTYAGLSGTLTAAHFHSLPGGLIVQGITFSDSSASGNWTGFADSVLSLAVKEQLYVNIHTSVNAGGEIRGALVPAGEFVFPIALDGAQASTASMATGTGWARLGDDYTTLSYDVTYGNLEGTFTAAHFHSLPGGGIVEGITFVGNTSSGELTGLTDTQIQDILRGRYYVNIHSSTEAGGEIRGDLRFVDGTFRASLDGAQAGTASTGQGTAWLYFDDADTARARVTFAGLIGPFTAGHIHLGAPILQGFTFTDSTGITNFRIPDSAIVPLLRGELYANIHSSVHPGGEIRGFFNVGSGLVTSVQEPSVTLPSRFVLDQNYPNPFNPSTIIRFSLADEGRVTIKIYTILGQVISVPLNEVRPAGSHQITFDGNLLPSGIYFYRLESERGNAAVRKMILIR